MKNKVLCYVRPWNDAQFKAIAESAWPDAEIVQFSEHKAVDPTGYITNYSISLKDADKIQCNLSDEQISDIILRCRLLRAIKPDEANSHVKLMYAALVKLFKDVQPKYILSVTVDSFILDVATYVADEFNIPFIGLVPTFVNEHFRITSKGEAIQSNLITDESVTTELKKKLLVNNYTPDFNKKSLDAPIKTSLVRWASNIGRYLYYKTKRLPAANRYNYHYWSSEVVSKENFNYFFPKLRPCSDWENKLNSSHKVKIYLPLQMFPECTVDYWCKDSTATKYYDVLFGSIEKLSGVSIILKEHPSVLGARTSYVYKRLSSYSNVTIVPTYCNSNNILNNVDSVLVWTGTIGFEAALRGLPVFTLGEPYYCCNDFFKMLNVDHFIEREVLSYIQEHEVVDIKERQNLLLKHLRSLLLPGKFKNDGTWSQSNEDDIRDAKIMGISIRNYLCKINDD